MRVAGNVLFTTASLKNLLMKCEHISFVSTRILNLDLDLDLDLDSVDEWLHTMGL